MVQEEAFTYWYPVSKRLFDYLYQENITGSALINPAFALDILLGVKEYEIYQSQGYEHDVPMAAELKRKLEMLNGQHWEAVLVANGITEDVLRRCLKPELKRKLEMLDGPHLPAILRANGFTKRKLKAFLKEARRYYKG